MELEWKLPTSLNGVLTGFTLVQSPSMTLYSGALTSHNVTNLTVHSAAQLNSAQLLSVYLVRHHLSFNTYT